MSEENKRVARRLLEDEISHANFAITEEVVHPDFVDHTNPPGMQHGIEGHQAIVRLFTASFPDLQWDIEDLIAEDDRVVARTVMQGTHLGDFFGLAPTGRKVTMRGIHIIRVAEGKVIEHWGCNDDLDLMRQLGAVDGL